MILSELTFAAAIPLAVAACVAFACRRMPGGIAWAAAVAIGFIAGQFALAARHGIPAALDAFLAPREAVAWLPFAVLLALGITMLTAFAPANRRTISRFLAIVFTIGLPLRLLAGSASVTMRWSVAERFAYLALLAGTFALTWLTLAAPADHDHPRLRPLLMILVAVGAAAVVTVSGVFVYGELCGVLAAAIGGAFLIENLPPARLGNPSGLAAVAACVFFSLILLSYFFGKLTLTNAALLLVSMLAAGGPMPAPLKPLSTWQQTTLRIAICLTPLAIAIAQSLAAANTPAASPYTA
jgi:hypothetical protein